MLSITVSPLFDWYILGALGAAVLILSVFGFWRRATGSAWRLAAALVLLATLVNPVLVEEEREPIPDVVTIVVDQSPSQGIGERNAQAEEAVRTLTGKLERLRGVEVRILRTGNTDAQRRDGTHLFDVARRSLASVSRDRVGATFLVTDGQVHDVPRTETTETVPGPVHVLLTGSPDEKDRQIEILNAPRYGLVGQTVEIEVRVSDNADSTTPVRVTAVQEGRPERILTVPKGRTFRVPLRIEHGGSNVLQLETAPLDGEITDLNNRAAIQINGVRERLRVLLISGEPHPGERVWRNLLKADPSVDLVHFTILRPPEKQDATPVRELALISFPTRELFEEKIAEFDLIIFDRYRRRGVLPNFYFENLVTYVANGGAVLNAVGPEFATPLSLYRTPLSEISPGRPTERVIEGGLLPRVTDYGQRHPVTAGLQAGDKVPDWGRWFRQVEADAVEGQVLMTGTEDLPLLILSRYGDGRVAQLLSDHIWLWARGFEKGGPHSEILRRLAHWLMQEPDLEEEDLSARVDGRTLVIVRRSALRKSSPVIVTTPSGAEKTVMLKEEAPGRAVGVMPAEEMGLYRLKDAEQSAVVAIGNLNPLEYADMKADRSKLAGIVEVSGGGMAWLQDGIPDLRRVRANRVASGSDWMGIVSNRDYRVSSVREIPLLPALVTLFLALGTLVWAWRREGR